MTRRQIAAKPTRTRQLKSENASVFYVVEHKNEKKQDPHVAISPKGDYLCNSLIGGGTLWLIP